MKRHAGKQGWIGRKATDRRDERIMNILYKRYRGWCILLLIAVFLEMVLANYSSLRIAGQTKQILTENGETDAEGFYEVPMTVVDGVVKNLAVKLTLEQAEYAQVTIFLTDEGDKYEYALPVTRVFPRIEDTAYINLYPYGEVKELGISITTTELAYNQLLPLMKQRPSLFSLPVFLFFFSLWPFSICFGSLLSFIAFIMKRKIKSSQVLHWQ